MEILKTHLHIGIKDPFCVLHASDTHITFVDDRDNDRKFSLSAKRVAEFPSGEADLAFLRKIALEENRTIIHTGDLIDFISERNFDMAKAFSDSVDVFMSAGNHEFTPYLENVKEDAAYRNLSLHRVQGLFKNDIRCASRIIGGVNFVAIDNSFYLIEQEQLDFLRKQTQREYPVVLCMHVPLYTKELYDFSRSCVGSGTSAYLMSVPEELMRDYPPHRYEQQKQDETTFEAYHFIANCKNIKAILCGHLHKNFECKINGCVRQIVTGLSTVREIYID